ncbi:myb-like protein V [Euwallacea fornicatus]|uniref:myb-like protein V n=1 Tax=Euwallacea fornicatus TaxID=995702 RepID=UPI00339030B1
MSHRHDSENEDDPEPFESSGDEWDMQKAKEEETGRRKSSRITRNPKKKFVAEESASDFEGTGSVDEEDDYFSEEEPVTKKQKRNTGTKKPAKPATKTKPIPKKQKVSNESELSNDDNSDMFQENNKKEKGNTDSDSSRTSIHVPSRGVHRKFIPKTIYSEDYATGSFVILKKDAQGGDPSKHPVIWRIDGKALLQKYEAFDEDDRVRHKNTSIYTGWSPLDKDLYAPITVGVVRHNNNNLTVEVQWETLKIINADSD